jgi:hypothetical protein
MLKQCVFLTLTAISLFANAGDLEVKITSYPSALPNGLPVSITGRITNKSGHALRLAYGYEGFRPSFRVETPDGKELKEDPRFVVAIKPSGRYTVKEVPADWTDYFTDESVCCMGGHPGRYVVRFIVTSKGDLKNCDGRELGDTWSGTVISEPVSISITEPAGIDKEAFEHFKGYPIDSLSEVLRLFPTSTYAGYALAHRGPREALWALTCLNDPDGELRKYSDMGGGEDNLRRRIAKAQAEMEAYAKIAEPFLQAHPDYPHAPLIRRMLAMCLGLTGHMPEALYQLRFLAQGDGKEADEAKAFLGKKAEDKAKTGKGG